MFKALNLISSYLRDMDYHQEVYHIMNKLFEAQSLFIDLQSSPEEMEEKLQPRMKLKYKRLINSKTKNNNNNKKRNIKYLYFEDYSTTLVPS